MSETVFSGIASDVDVQGTLFRGLKFWISQKVPQRSRFLSDVKVNGGFILPLEKNADVKIVDHARKEAPPGSHSYTFIEKSIRNGTLEDLDDHTVGPPEGSIRSIGSIVQPAKGTRNRYTEADDRILWNWVNDNPQKGGGTDGNEIYKQLEKKHSQHPWQSWRDRWIKHLKGKTAPFLLPHNAPPTPPFDAPSVTEPSNNRATASKSPEDNYQSFSDEDAEALMANGDSILNIHPDKITEVWESWTRDHDKDSAHTAQQWHSFWEESVRPRYLRRKAKQARRASPEKTVPQVPTSPERPKVIPSSDTSASIKRDCSFKPTIRSPSYPPESPTKIATAPSKPSKSKATDMVDMPSLSTNEEQHTLETPEELRSPYCQTLKRKHTAIEEDLPSSSPVEQNSPKRRWSSASEVPVEIASTPEKGRQPAFEEPSSPLYIKLELEEDEPNVSANFTRNDSLVGQQLSDTLSEPDHVVNNTQALFGNATPLVDFDVPAPEGGWDYEDFLDQTSSQPVSIELPLADDIREDSKHGIRGSPQPVDFDLDPPEGGWDEREAEVKAGFDSSNTEIYDPQPTLPDTQAILRSKTPAPDFSIPDPDGGWNSLIASSPPAMPDSPRAESVFSQTELQDRMDAWIEAHAVKGISVEQVESVLKNTSLDTALADKALQHLAKKGVLPKDWTGVWTESDDEDLKSSDARKIQRLERKHGADCLTARWEFLDFYADEAR